MIRLLWELTLAALAAGVRWLRGQSTASHRMEDST